MVKLDRVLVIVYVEVLLRIVLFKFSLRMSKNFRQSYSRFKYHFVETLTLR